MRNNHSTKSELNVGVRTSDAWSNALSFVSLKQKVMENRNKKLIHNHSESLLRYFAIPVFEIIVPLLSLIKPSSNIDTLLKHLLHYSIPSRLKHVLLITFH